MQDDDGDMKLSVGVFNSTPTKYARIKKLIAGNFTSNDSEIINQAIIGVSLKKEKVEKKAEEVTVVERNENTEEVQVHTTLDLERETACYNHAVVCAKKMQEDIKHLQDAGVPSEYLLSRYPNIEERLSDVEALLSVQRMELSAATEKKNSLKSKVEKILAQLKSAEYEEYLRCEALISSLRSCTESLDFDDSLKPMLEEDLAELNKLKRIKELEEELAALKSEGKFVTPTQSTTPAPVVEKPVVELEVELPTEQQDKEIRFLANHLYQVRRGHEKHNPTICRRIAELSAELKLSKEEFCKKILSISMHCYNDRHRKDFVSLGLYLYGERHTAVNKVDPKNPNPIKDEIQRAKDEIQRWSYIHLIKADDNEVLNRTVYDKFVKDTGVTDISSYRFYNIMARSFGYTPKCKYSRKSGKTVLSTYYVGYRLV